MIDLRDPNVVQTEEICMEAVKRNGYVLRHIHNQTKAMCLEAVKQFGCALQHVHNQTYGICLQAVRTDGIALGYVKNQTDDICIEAVSHCDYHCYPSTYFKSVYNDIKYPSPQLINRLLQLYPSYTNTIMNRDAINIRETYKKCSSAIVLNIARYIGDLLYRPNNVKALISQTRWHKRCSKTVFLLI
jgi:hypothetical protein